MPQPPYLQTGESVVLYDGVCKLCTGWVRFLLRHRLARQVRFASVQSEQGKGLLKWAGLPEDNINTIVYIRSEGHWLRAQAVLRVMQQLPLPWRALSVLRAFPDPISNFFSTTVSRSTATGCLGAIPWNRRLRPIIRGVFSHRRLTAVRVRLNPR